jgi:hypothetical protein
LLFVDVDGGGGGLDHSDVNTLYILWPWIKNQKIYFEKKKNKIIQTRYNQVDVVVVRDMRKSFIVFVLTNAHTICCLCVRYEGNISFLAFFF